MNNPFDSKYGLPGTAVMDGYNAAVQANRNYQAMMNDYHQRKELERNLPVMEAQRQIQLSDLNAALPLTQIKNDNLVKLGRLGPINSSSDYIKAKETLEPLPQGYKYEEGKDANGNKLLYTKAPDGTLSSPQPIYTGRSATNHLALTHGRNLYTLPELLPNEQYKEGTIQAQMASANNRAYMDQQNQLMKLLMGGAVGGLRGTGSGGKAGGGKGKGGSDATGSGKGYSHTEEAAAYNAAEREAFITLGIRNRDADGILYDYQGNQITDPAVYEGLYNATMGRVNAGASAKAASGIEAGDAQRQGSQLYRDDLAAQTNNALGGMGNVVVPIIPGVGALTHPAYQQGVDARSPMPDISRRLQQEAARVQQARALGRTRGVAPNGPQYAPGQSWWDTSVVGSLTPGSVATEHPSYARAQQQLSTSPAAQLFNRLF